MKALGKELAAGCLGWLVANGALGEPLVRGIYGSLEEVRLQLPGQPVALYARLDTGALMSSLDARHMRRFDRNGVDWVDFKVRWWDAGARRQVTTEVQAPIIRYTPVRTSMGEELRPVVSLPICIDSRWFDEEFTLKDRRLMNFPVLIGRQTLVKLGVVDVSRVFITRAHCPPRHQ